MSEAQQHLKQLRIFLTLNILKTRLLCLLMVISFYC